LKVSANVKIAMQCFENFGGGGQMPHPGCAPVVRTTAHFVPRANCNQRAVTVYVVFVVPPLLPSAIVLTGVVKKCFIAAFCL